MSTIDKRIDCLEASQILSDSTSTRVYAALEPHRDIAEKVVSFVQRFSSTKFSLNRKNSPPDGRRNSVDIRANILDHLPTKLLSSSASTSNTDSSRSSSITTPFSLIRSDIGDVSTEVQELYYQIEEMFRVRNSKDENDDSIGNMLDRVEEIICFELYDWSVILLLYPTF